MTKAPEDAFRYDRMVEKALRGVVKQTLDEILKDGVSGEHSFYVTFHTQYPGVHIPEYLRERYPGEMTIVLQHQFYDLEVLDDKFSVMLSFNSVPERLSVPYSAITIFSDPSVNFSLQFQPLGEDEGDDYQSEELALDQATDKPAKGEVVSLDQFRNKKDKE